MEANSRSPALSRSQPNDGAVYQVALQFISQENTGQMLRITSVRDGPGIDMLRQKLKKVVSTRTDPFWMLNHAQQAVTSPPQTVTGEPIERWFGVLLSQTSSPWSTRFIWRATGATEDHVSGLHRCAEAGIGSGTSARGVSYHRYSNEYSLHFVNEAKYRQVQVGDDRIEILFVLRDLPSTVAAGNGISGTWKGLLQRSRPCGKGLSRLTHADIRRSPSITVSGVRSTAITWKSSRGNSYPAGSRSSPQAWSSTSASRRSNPTSGCSIGAIASPAINKKTRWRGSRTSPSTEAPLYCVNRNNR